MINLAHLPHGGTNPRIHEVGRIRLEASSIQRPIPYHAKDYVLVNCGGLYADKNGLASFNWNSATPRLTLDDALTATGEWIGVFRNDSNNEVIVASDFFGYCPISWTVHNGYLYFGSTIKGLSAFLHSLTGTSNEIAWEAVHPHLSSNETIFKQRASHQSFLKNVQTLAPDELLHITPLGVAVSPRHFLSDPDSRDAESLIRAGVERATRQLQWISAQEFGSVDLPLSGGKDSRAVLALVLAAGKQREVRTYTHDPLSFPPGPQQDMISGDFPIALALADRYGIKWRDPHEATGRSVSFEESLSYFQDWRGGQSFDFQANAVLWENEEAPRIDLGGGGGELYRAYYGHQALQGYPAWAKTLSHAPENIIQELCAFFDSACPDEYVPRNLHQIARQFFALGLARTGGKSAIDALTLFYPYHRNRYHFGQMRVSLSQRRVVHYLLAQPEFFWAFQALPQEERSDGNLLFKLYEAVDPTLNAIPFDHGHLPEGFATAGTYTKNVSDFARSSRVLDSYRAMQERQRVHGGLSVDNPRRIDKNAEAAQFNLQAIERIREHDNKWIGSILRRVHFTETLNEKSRLAMSSKLQSILDVLGNDSCPISLASYSVRWDDMIPDSRKLSRDSIESRPFSIVRQENTLPEVQLVVKCDSGKLTAEITPSAPNIEIAYYAYKDGECVVRDWYKPRTGDSSVSALCDTSPESRYRVSAFLRLKGSSNAQKVIHSETFVAPEEPTNKVPNRQS